MDRLPLLNDNGLEELDALVSGGLGSKVTRDSPGHSEGGDWSPGLGRGHGGGGGGKRRRLGDVGGEGGGGWFCGLSLELGTFCGPACLSRYAWFSATLLVRCGWLYDMRGEEGEDDMGEL